MTNLLQYLSVLQATENCMSMPHIADRLHVGPFASKNILSMESNSQPLRTTVQYGKDPFFLR